MHLDAKVHPINYINGFPTKDFTVSVDEDYIDDYDQLLDAVEAEIWKTYGCAAHANVDFTIPNDKELCDEIFSKDERSR